MRYITRAEGFRSGVDEIHEASSAVELGKEYGGVGLRVRVLDPQQTRPDAAVLAASFPKNPASIAAHSHGWILKL